MDNEILGNVNDGSFSPAPPLPGPPQINQDNEILGNVNDGSFQTPEDFNEDKYGTTSGLVKTGLEGAASGYLSEPLSTESEVLSGSNPEDIRKRRETNPWTYGLSEAGGFLGSILTEGGLAPILSKLGEGAKVATGLGDASGVVAKLASSGVGAAAEMAALQSGHELTNVILKDPGFSVDQAAINIGLSGLLGFTGGAALGGVSQIWNSTMKDGLDGTLGLIQNKMNGVGLPENADFSAFLKTAEDEGFKIPPEIKAGLSASPEAQNLFKTLRESGSSSSEALKQVLEDTKGIAQDQITNIMGGENGPSAFEAGESAKAAIMQKAEDLNTEARSKYDLVGDTKDIQIPDAPRLKFYDGLIEDGQNFGANGSPSQNLFKIYAERALSQDTVGQLDLLNTEIGSEMSIAYRAGDSQKYKALAQIRDSIRDFQDTQIGRAVADVAKPIPTDLTPAEYQERNINPEDFYHQKVANEVIAQRKEARANWSDFMTNISDMASMSKVGKVKSYSQFMDAMENVPSAKLANRLFDKQNIEGLRKLRDEYPDIYEKILAQQKGSILESATKQNVLNHNTVMNRINSLPKEVRNMMFSPQELEGLESAHGVIRKLNERLNPSGTAGTFKQAMKHMMGGVGGLLGAMSGHGFIGGALLGELTGFLGGGGKDMAKLAFLKAIGSGEPLEASALKSSYEYLNSVVSGAKAFGNATKNVFKAGSMILPSNLLPNDESRDKLKKDLNHLSMNPQSIMEVGSPIAKYLPDHATMVARDAGAAVTYLNSLKPIQPVSNGLDRPPKSDFYAENKYNRALDIAQQPLMVLQHIQDGDLLPQDVQTLTTIYPQLHAQMVNKLIEEMINVKSEGQSIPYGKRLGLSLLMGQPMDSTMSVQGMQAIMMSAGNQQQQAQQAQASSKKVSEGGLKAIGKTDSLYETPLESRQINRKS